jgi:hypothetical protein
MSVTKMNPEELRSEEALPGFFERVEQLRKDDLPTGLERLLKYIRAVDDAGRRCFSDYDDACREGARSGNLPTELGDQLLALALMDDPEEAATAVYALARDPDRAKRYRALPFNKLAEAIMLGEVLDGVEPDEKMTAEMWRKWRQRQYSAKHPRPRDGWRF